ncbi:MAG: helix-turn-helix domain-containing protein [Nannocystaceae bacterium]
MRVPTSRLRIIRDPEDSLGELPSPTTPGALLEEVRTQNNLSLEELASLTKIPRSSLESLEQDRYDDLPGPVFVKGFLRCCARTLEVDPELFFELLYAREDEEAEANTGAEPVRKPSEEVADSVFVIASAEAEAEEDAEAPVEKPKPEAPAAPSLLLEMVLRARDVVVRTIAGVPSRQLLWIAVVALIALLVLAAFTLGISSENVFAPAS